MGQQGVIVCGGLDEVAAVQASWSPGSPFPLLPGSALERYRRRLGTELPVVRPDSRAGLVLSVGRAGLLAGRLLASATARPHEHVDIHELETKLTSLADRVVVLVCLAEDVAALEDWPGRLVSRLGVLVARDAPGLLCLVYRSLTMDALDIASTFVATHPAQPDAVSADAVGLDEIEVLRERPAGALVLRSFGRECCVNFPDGVICGRSDHGGTPLPLVTSLERVPSCLRGEGCYRTDLDERQRIPAAEVNASLVFMQACSTIALGNNVFPTSVGVALGFLDGTAVAVIGAVGLHVDDVALRTQFEEAAARGTPLGEMTAALNRTARERHGAQSRFGLLGDPGLALRWGEPGHAPIPASPDRDADALPLARLAHWTGVVLPRLRRLAWLNVVVDEDRLAELARRIRNAATELSGPKLAAEALLLAEDIDAVQAEVVSRTLERVHGTWWQLTAGQLSTLEEESAEDVSCPGCALPRATSIRLRHRVEAGLVLTVLQCTACGDVLHSVGEPEVATTSPGVVWARRSELVALSVGAASTDSAHHRGVVGWAFVAGGHTGLPTGRSRALPVAPGRDVRAEWAVSLSGTGARADEHDIAYVSLYDGVLTVRTGRLCLLGD